MNTFRRSPSQGGFSLVELTIVVVILGVLATFAVPRFMTSVERSKAAESYTYLSQIESAQERYNARHGEYAKNVTDLDIDIQNPQYFSVGTMTSANWEDQWELKLTRSGASSGFGQYTVVFDQNGYNDTKSSIPPELKPVK